MTARNGGVAAPQTFRPAVLDMGQQGSAGTTGRVGEGEASARPIGCDYAHCHERRVWRSDGWLFCARHYLEHRSLFHGARWPHNRGTYDPNITELVGKDVLPCGTTAAHKRHMRRGEQPCEECRQAYNRMRVDGDRRRRARMQEAS